MPKTSGTRAFNDANCSGITNRLGTEDVVVIDAKHLCVNSRGISDIEQHGNLRIWWKI
jgi:hypothetical protein